MTIHHFFGSFRFENPCDLLQPPFHACFGENKIASAFVPVPEASVHKEVGFIFGEDDVRFAWEGCYNRVFTKQVT